MQYPSNTDIPHARGKLHYPGLNEDGSAKHPLHSAASTGPQFCKKNMDLS